MRSSMTFATLLALTSLLFTPQVAAQADLQTSLTLDQSVLAAGFSNDGQDIPAPGQVRSLTSKNNFINFCISDLAKGLPITDGKQIIDGSCNPTPMGLIPATTNMPGSKFTNPVNLQTFVTKTPFIISMAIERMQTGAFTNAQANFFAAPQQLNVGGQIIGHSHVVIEKLDSYEHAEPLDNKDFFFFKGLNNAAAAGILSTEMPGLVAGIYRLSSINTAANHQPVLVPVAQHGSMDDVVYFAVTDDGLPPPGAPTADGKSVSSVSASGSASSAIPSASASGSASVAGSASTSGSASASSVASSAVGVTSSAPEASASAKPSKAASSAIKPSSAAEVKSTEAPKESAKASSSTVPKASETKEAKETKEVKPEATVSSSEAASPSAGVKARRASRMQRRSRFNL